MILGLTRQKQTVEEKLIMVKSAMRAIEQAPNLSDQAKARGLRSLENAYRRLKSQLSK